MNAFIGDVAMDPHAMHQIARPSSLTESAGSILWQLVVRDGGRGLTYPATSRKLGMAQQFSIILTVAL